MIYGMYSVYDKAAKLFLSPVNCLSFIINSLLHTSKAAAL